MNGSRSNEGTSGGYLDEAERQLGPKTVLDQLARYKVITQSYRPPDGAFSRSHLIGAFFGGQLKYPARDNVRFHPGALEYGEWQTIEKEVQDNAKEGTLVVHSVESGPATVTRLAAQIVELLDPADKVDWQKPLGQDLRAAEFVPEVVTFDYLDVDGSRSTSKSWQGQNAGLTINPAATPALAQRALEDAEKHGSKLVSPLKSLPPRDLGQQVKIGNLQQLLAFINARDSNEAAKGRCASTCKALAANDLIPDRRHQLAVEINKFLLTCKDAHQVSVIVEPSDDWPAVAAPPAPAPAVKDQQPSAESEDDSGGSMFGGSGMFGDE